MSVQLEAIRAFHRIPLFTSLSEEETYEIVRICRIHRLSEGSWLFRQGDEGRSLYFLESGSLDVVLEKDGREEVVARFGEFDVVGELALIEPAPRSASARATSESVVYEIVASDFDRLKSNGHPAAFKVIRALSRIVCKRIRAVNERIEAELAGAAPPDPSRVSRTATSRRVGASGAHTTAPREESGMFRRIAQRLWRGGNEDG